MNTSARTFTRAELSFFAIPRRWTPEILARFGDDGNVRDAIMQVDSDGGLAMLAWIAKQKAWVLTDRGQQFVGARLFEAGKRWQPNEQEKARWERALARAAAKAARGEDADDGGDD